VALEIEMARYLVVPALACLVLGAALYFRGGPDPAPAAAGRGRPPEALLRTDPSVEVERGPEGRLVRVTCLCAGGVSRASLRYERAGKTEVADRSEDCGRALAGGGSVAAEGPTTEVRLAGLVPEDAHEVHVLLESETGTTRVPLALP